ncbi:uncharacterized protein PRCAT00000264001 [Priceomyces carsonii]|uniref:uncharacterized protein n=1 Tax=Priceomyces carsonii TaxID=28549 RepID=UPI002EDB7A58|nr:unnamed protein product [Priceomyces carsonii]
MLLGKLIRPVSFRRVIHVRFVSSLLKKDPHATTLNQVKEILLEASKKDDCHLSNLIKHFHKSNNSQRDEIMNELVSNASNFSIYFKIKDLKLPTESLLKLMKLNPERVFENWDLLEINSANKDDPVLLLKTLESIATNLDRKEEDLSPSIVNLSRVLYLLTKVNINDVQFSVWTSLIDFVKNKDFESILNIIDLPDNYLLETLESDKISGNKLLTFVLFQKLFKKNPELISKHLFLKAVDTFDRIQAKDLLVYNEGQSKRFDDLIILCKKLGILIKFEPLDDLLRSKIVHYIDINKLDHGDSIESLMLRLKVIEFYSMTSNDINKALKKFHHYQVHEKWGFELVEQKLIIAYCYQAIREDKVYNLKIAETLMQQEVPIRQIQGMILAKANFDLNDALQLYNDYIPVVSKQVNETTKRSSSGLLVEAVVLSFLYKEDREFASLVLDKSIENGIISDETEIRAIKSLLKVYSDSHLGSGLVLSNMKEYVLRYLKSL